MASSLWTAHPDCPAHVKSELETRVRSLPPSFLAPPAVGEVFENPDLCQERLQGFALSQGFVIIRQSGSLKQARPRFEFRCIHHAAHTRNTRQLESHVERDEEDNIITRRQQEYTNINARNCPYLVTLVRKQLIKRGSGIYGLVLSAVHDTHSHEMAVNPFRYKQHVSSLPGYQPAIELGRSLRSANISYSAAFRVLEQSGFPLDRHTYYNIRSRSISAEKDEFAGLIVALEDAGFEFECRVDEEYNKETNELVDRQLQQIWFAHPRQIYYAQRFIADWALFVDGTFRTNALNLVLIVTAGVTNCGSTFVSSLSFARSEAKLSFDFIFESLKKRVFIPPIPLPRVVISDQAAGMRASLPNVLPNAILQFCDWHAVQNVEKRLADKGYPKSVRKEMKQLLWAFIKSSTKEELEQTRADIHSKLKSGEIQYLEEFWRPKEQQFLRLYTRKYPNLGAHSNQRSESLHPGTKDILNKQLSLEEASRRLGQTLQTKFRQLAEEEARDGGKLPRTLDQKAFVLLTDTISCYAISKISSEWEITKQEINRGILRADTLFCTDCELILRFGLPCKHYLAVPCQDGASIPRSLVHPRWWIHGEPIQQAEWVPTLRTVTLPISPPRNLVIQSNPFISPRRNEITGLGLQILEAREGLTGYARTRYDSVATNAQQGLLQFAQQLQKDDLHTRMPDAVKDSGWNRRFKSHDKANKRLMTGAEAAEKDAEKREQVAERATEGPAKERTEGPGEERTEVPEEERTEGPTEEAEEDEQAVEDAFLPPPSTAPAKMQVSRAGRKRALTTKALEAEQAPKRGTGQGKGRGGGRGRGRGSRGAA